MALPFLQKTNLPELARQLNLASYTPEIKLEGLRTGVDNVRTDVWLSPRFMEVTASHIGRLLARYANVEDFLTEDSFTRSNAPAAPPPPDAPRTGYVGPAQPKQQTTTLFGASAGFQPTVPATSGFVGSSADDKSKTTTIHQPGSVIPSPLQNVG